MKKTVYRPKVGKYDSLFRRETVTYSMTDPPKPGELSDMSVEADISAYEEWARNILRDSDLPDHLRALAYKANGEWRELADGERPADGEGACMVTHLVKDKPLSQEWYAAHVLLRAYCVSKAIEENDAEKAAWNAMRMSEHYEHAIFRGAFERDVLVERARSLESKKAKRVELERFKEAYRTARDENPNLSRVRVINSICIDFTLSDSRLIALAREVDRKDGINRSPGAPKKR